VFFIFEAQMYGKSFKKWMGKYNGEKIPTEKNNDYSIL